MAAPVVSTARRTTVLMLSALFVLGLAGGTAAAQDQQAECYPDCTATTAAPEPGDVGTEDTGDSTTTTAPASQPGPTDTGGGSLPVTGGDALGLAALGAALTGAGAVLVVGSRRRENAA